MHTNVRRANVSLLMQQNHRSLEKFNLADMILTVGGGCQTQALPGGIFAFDQPIEHYAEHKWHAGSVIVGFQIAPLSGLEECPRDSPFRAVSPASL
jgi:hypothetical protein